MDKLPNARLRAQCASLRRGNDSRQRPQGGRSETSTQCQGQRNGNAAMKLVCGVRLLLCIGWDTLASEFGHGSSAWVRRSDRAQELSIRSPVHQSRAFLFHETQMTSALPSWSGGRLVYHGNMSGTAEDAMHAFVNVTTAPQGPQKSNRYNERRSIT